MYRSTKDITLLKLWKSRNLSLRGFNVCQHLGFNTVRELSIFILRNRNNIEVMGCGEKIQKELMEIHNHFLPELLGIQEQFPVSPLVKKSRPLGRVRAKDNYFSTQAFASEPLILDLPEAKEGCQGYDEKYIKILVEKKFQKLRVRSKNALMHFFDNTLPGKAEIWKYFIQNKFSAHKLRNVGSKTAIEIEGFVNAAVEIFNTIRNEGIPPVELAEIKLKEITGMKISAPALLDKFSKNEMPIISFAAKHLKELLHLNEIEETVIKNQWGLLDKLLSVDEIAERHLLSSGRIQQIRKRVINKVAQPLSKLSALMPFSKYETIFNNRTVLSIPEGINDENINEEIAKTGNLFASFILPILFKSSYYCISANDHIEKPNKIQWYEKYKAHNKIKGVYLIKNTIVSREEVLNLYKKVFGLLCLRQEEKLYIKISSLANQSIDDQVIEVVKFILENEFGISVERDFIVIPRNTPKLLYEYAEDALKQIGKPAHIGDIYAAVKTEYPGFKYSMSSLRSAIFRYKKIFISIGRTNTFGLKSWESEYENIKGGSINDIVAEFLNAIDKPCHISKIVRYVSKFRSAKIRSISNMLRAGDNNRFVFFKDRYVGLKSKKYSKKIN